MRGLRVHHHAHAPHLLHAHLHGHARVPNSSCFMDFELLYLGLLGRAIFRESSCISRARRCPGRPSPSLWRSGGGNHSIYERLVGVFAVLYDHLLGHPPSSCPWSRGPSGHGPSRPSHLRFSQPFPSYCRRRICSLWPPPAPPQAATRTATARTARAAAHSSDRLKTTPYFNVVFGSGPLLRSGPERRPLRAEHLKLGSHGVGGDACVGARRRALVQGHADLTRMGYAWRATLRTGLVTDEHGKVRGARPMCGGVSVSVARPPAAACAPRMLAVVGALREVHTR